MNGREVDMVGRGWYSNIYVLNLKASFLPVKTSSFHHTKVWNTKHSRVLERMVLCIVLAVGSLPPYVHLVSTTRPPEVIHVMNAPNLPCNCECKGKIKTGEDWD